MLGAVSLILYHIPMFLEHYHLLQSPGLKDMKDRGKEAEKILLPFLALGSILVAIHPCMSSGEEGLYTKSKLPEQRLSNQGRGLLNAEDGTAMIVSFDPQGAYNILSLFGVQLRVTVSESLDGLP